MTSMFDQYEQASQRSAPISAPEVPSSGYVSMSLREDTPIFSKQKMQFTPSDRIIHLAVANDFLVLAMANNTLFRIDFKTPSKNEEIPIHRPTHRISGIFLDPLGNHLLISMAPRQSDPSELLYLNRRSTKPKPTSKFRGLEVTEVGWNYENTSENSTGHILLGTARGLLFETEIGIDGDKIFPTSLEQYWRQLPNYLPLYGNKDVDGLVFDIGKGNNMPITGIEFYRVPNTNRYLILVTTPQRLYQFSGNSSPEDKCLLQPVFNTYLNTEEQFQEIPSTLRYSRLRLYYESPDTLPKTFAWLTEPGLFYGKINAFNKENACFAIHGKLLQYPAVTPNEDMSKRKPTSPLSFILTQFHALILYHDTVKGVSLLNNEIIFEDAYSDTFGRLMNITKDHMKGTIWAFSEKAVFRYKVTRELRNVWQIYADKHEFELAKKYCQDNPAHIDKIQVKQAENLFNNGDFKQSAIIYAETQSSFEGICLKFLQADQIESLQLFLRKKLERFKPQDKTQITMIVVWIIELFLNQIGKLRTEGLNDSPKCLEMQNEFDRFMKLPYVSECIKNNKSVIYELMASHGDNENLLKLTVANKDFDEVISQCLFKGQYNEALDFLRVQNKSDLFYKHCPILMEEIPKLTVNTLIAQGRKLDPAKLLPALVGAATDEAHISEIMRYLEFCVHSAGCTEQAVHNFLLTLYASNRSDKLMQYLATQGQDVAMVNYDVHYALRLCREKHLLDACVQLSALLGLWEAAVELALGINLKLAKNTADQSSHDPELRKKLWLRIARHVVSGKDDIQQAMEFLRQCDFIRIEDLLPFFSDFVTIDHFKDAICNSLQEYNQHINDLKEEMEEATRSAERVRSDIVSFRNRSSIVTVRSSCEFCGVTLMLRPFYLFPCGHKFHADCLQQKITPHLGTAKANRLQDLQRQLASNQLVLSDSVSHGSTSMSQRDLLKEELDTLIAAECWLCGEHMIQSIDKPFIPDDQWDYITRAWE